MNFITYADTDIGIAKDTNQDSLTVHTASIGSDKVAFAVLCDGMGGLSEGELASATTVKVFSDWFKKEFPELLKIGLSGNAMRQSWGNLAVHVNEKIMGYGHQKGITIGTTLVVLLVACQRYYVMNIGDSRLYEIGKGLKQITKDHTLISREILKGNLTEEQAKTDPRRSVLLQCIGASKSVNPDFFEGIAMDNMTYMLCSDGFRHEISEEEIYSNLHPSRFTESEDMGKRVRYLIDLNKKRMEKDNISVAIIKTVS